MTNITIKYLINVTIIFLVIYTKIHAATPISFPQQNEHDYIINKFTFHDGKTLNNLRIHYITLGNPKNKPVLVLHGTTATSKTMLSKDFGQELFGSNMPLDANKYFIIIPDSLGAGQSSKPSDGLKGNFPQYTYKDMVNAEHELLANGLHIPKMYLIIGYSMGGMETWDWAILYPKYITGIVSLAATPTAMSARNWIMRKMVIDSVTQDPDWDHGFYTKQPQKFQSVYAYYKIISNGGVIAWQKKASNVTEANQVLQQSLNSKIDVDANDFLYQWNASRDFDPSHDLHHIQCYVLAINSADDERNPYMTGDMDKAIHQIPYATYKLIPASSKTSGHNTTMHANLWKKTLVQFMKQLHRIS